MEPRITAVIPYYKGAKYIRQAVESVIEQTILPTELIIIDDGSPDGGPHEALAGLETDAFPVIHLRQENAGQSAARNYGIRQAKGDFIALLD